MKVPIQNLYYLLGYAYFKLTPAEMVQVDLAHAADFWNLLARVLIEGGKRIKKAGLDWNYQLSRQSGSFVRGRLLVRETVSQNRLNRGMVLCEADEFTIDHLHHQIIKATLARLLQTEGLSEQNKAEVKALWGQLAQVRTIVLQKSTFQKVRLHRNNRLYQLPLKVCELIFLNTLPNEAQGKFNFLDFEREDGLMAHLFEEFIRAFYQRHLSDQFTAGIEREDFSWRRTAGPEEHLPQMKTDLVLRSPDRLLVLDAKYYAQAVKGKSEKVIETNLYQLYAYLKNIEDHRDEPAPPEGILMYPKNGSDIHYHYILDGHSIQVVTIDLHQDWQSIHNRMLKAI